MPIQSLNNFSFISFISVTQLARRIQLTPLLIRPLANLRRTKWFYQFAVVIYVDPMITLVSKIFVESVTWQV